MIKILTGDCISILATLPAESVQCCVTSPPYWGLRDYGTATWEGGDAGCDHIRPNREQRAFNGQGIDYGRGSTESSQRSAEPYFHICAKCGARRIDSQLGLESTPEEYIGRMVAVFREVWRVLRDDGTLWVNMGDSYHNGDKGGYAKDRVTATDSMQRSNLGANFIGAPNRQPQKGLKPKDLCMMPARLAMALQANGWYLRSDIIWHKPNPMPESVTDRPTKSHEYIFLLAKQERYFYDAGAIMEMALCPEGSKRTHPYFIPGQRNGENANLSGSLHKIGPREFRNKRSVWTVATQPYSEAHFATFPEDLIKPCILAGSKPGDTVLDPFAGSGTTGKVAMELGRKAILIELNPEYIRLAKDRTFVTAGFF